VSAAPLGLERALSLRAAMVANDDGQCYVTSMAERHDTVIIGGGQAGLAMSYFLREQGREHVIVERRSLAERWRSERWDSLCFQFPNWSFQLPGHHYNGDAPDAFAHYFEVVRYLETYADTIEAPLRSGVDVASLTCDPATGRFRIATPESALEASRVVIATGPFQRPTIPQLAKLLPADVFQVHSSRYRNPAELPAGAVLVVGSGGSGSQIAEELVQAGRGVFLTVSRHRRVPRNYRGRDALWWSDKLGRFEVTIESLPGRRPLPTILYTGVGGGHDMDVRRLGDDGAVLLGRLLDCSGTRLSFDASASGHLAFADESCAEFTRAIDDNVRETGMDAPESDVEKKPRTAAIRGDPVLGLDLRSANITSVIWCTGYGFDFGWVGLPIFDDRGTPMQHRGVTSVPGAYFLGLHWMHKFKSGTLWGVGEDAAYLAEHMLASK
jgi:putative flavoprotein involved in K+ transport